MAPTSTTTVAAAGTGDIVAVDVSMQMKWLLRLTMVTTVKMKAYNCLVRRQFGTQFHCLFLV